MYQRLIMAVAMALSFHCAGQGQSVTTASLPKVLISQVVEHPALDETTRGIIDGLQANGFKQGESVMVRVESAQASAVLASQIASKFVNQQPAVVVGVGTLSAQSFGKAARERRTKLIFSSVTDPLAVELVESLENPGYNTSGVSNFIPLEPQLALFKKIQPRLKRLGILYNPGEINTVRIVQNLEAICPQVGLTLIKQAAIKTGDIPQASARLARQVDALLISNDNTALAAFPSIVRAAHKVGIPVYVSDTDAVTQGALLALGPNQYTVGLQTGAMVARVLRGEEIANLPVEFPHETQLVINLEVATRLGITIPEEIRLQATLINSVTR